MKHVLTIGGSNSKKSINKVLAEHVGDMLEDVRLTKLDLNDYEMPLFSVDQEEKYGFSDATLALNDVVERADGFIISLAEHNGAYSAVFKNTFDWLSRIEGKVWRNKPMLLLSTSPGARGGQSVLNIALGRFPFNGGNIVGSLAFPSFFDNFSDGKVVNVELEQQLKDLVDSLKSNL